MEKEIKEQSRILKYLVNVVLEWKTDKEFEQLVRDNANSAEWLDIDYDRERYSAMRVFCLNLGINMVCENNSVLIIIDESITEFKSKYEVKHGVFNSCVLRSNFLSMVNNISLVIYQNFKVCFDGRLMFEIFYSKDLE